MIDLFDDSTVADYVQDKIYETVGKIKRIQDRWNFRCPICGDSKKSKHKARGNYYPKTNSYHCFNEGCTASGLWIVAKFQNIDITEVKKDFISYSRKINSGNYDRPSAVIDINPTELSTNKEAQSNGLQLPSEWTIDLPLNVREYLAKRKLLSAPYCPKNWQLYYDIKTHRIGIPWIREKQIKFWQTRATSKNQYPKYDSSLKSEKDIFNYDMIDPLYPFVFMLEGVFDAIWVKNGVALAGVSITSHQQSLLDRVDNKKVWMFDNQWTDSTALKKTMKIFTNHPNDLVFVWPSEIIEKDVNELILNDPDFVNKFSDFSWMSSNIYNGLRGLIRMKKGQ